MYTAKIVDIKKDVMQVDQTPFLDVELEIINEKGEVAVTRKLGFPLDASDDFIKSEVAKYVKTYGDDIARSERTKEQDELHAKADTTIEALKGASIEAAGEQA